MLYQFVETYGINKWALSTYASKKGLIDNYVNPYIGDWNLADATPRAMDEYYKKLLSVKAKRGFRQPEKEVTLSARNIREIHKVLRCAFNQAVKWEYISRNPVEHASLPKSEPKERAIRTAETLFHALELCEDERLALAINLAFSCSLRIGELTGLTWDCVDVSEESLANNNAFIYIEKELSRVSRDAMDELDNWNVLISRRPLLSRHGIGPEEAENEKQYPAHLASGNGSANASGQNRFKTIGRTFWARNIRTIILCLRCLMDDLVRNGLSGRLSGS